MRPELMRPADPAAGYHRVVSARRFRYIERDPDHTIRVTWLAQDLACPACQTDTGLQLVLDEAIDRLVRVYCPRQHDWAEPRIEPAHFITYSRLQTWVDPDPDSLWIMDAGFGEVDPPPIDYVADIKAGWGYGLKYAKRRAKSKAKAAIRKPVRQAKRRLTKAAHRPVAAALRAAWTWQAGSAPHGTQPRPEAEPGPKIPSAAKYRKAYGMPAPQRGPRCLVCDDTGTIPDTPIPCTECEGPAAAALADAERRAERARRG